MFLGDVRGEAIGRHSFPAEPAEGLAGRDVDSLHPNSMSGSLFARQAQAGAQAPVVVGKWLLKTEPRDQKSLRRLA